MFNKIMVFFVIISLTIACTPSPEALATQTAGALTQTQEATAIIKPTPTLNPNGDPDGDGYITYFENEWGSDPSIFTTFEELTQLPRSIYARMRVSQPFSRNIDKPMIADIDELNSTVFQVVSPDYSIDGNETPENYSDDHISFEVVLFPNSKQQLIPMEVEEFPIAPSVYNSEVREFLITKEDDVSNITEEMKNTMLNIVNGTVDGFSTQAKTDIEAVNRIIAWNRINLKPDPIYETFYPPYGEIISMRAGDMFSTRITRYCTTRATILCAELRSIGIPCKIFSQISCICNPNDDPNCDNRGSHFQNGVYLGGQWVLYDFNSDNPRSNPYYDNLVIVDSFRDLSGADFDYWLEIIDTPRINYPFDLLYYTYERIEK